MTFQLVLSASSGRLVLYQLRMDVGGGPVTEHATSSEEETSVSFAQLTDEELKGYIETGEPFDKAGAYGIQARNQVPK